MTPEEIVGSPERIQINYPGLLSDLEVDDVIFINDGIIRLRVTEVLKNDLKCIVEAGGLISDHKGCNIPSGKISVQIPTEKDKQDLKLIAELDPEYVAASFVGSAADVEKVRSCLASHGNTRIKIISKIERPIALKNINEIIRASNGIMVARGDLGVEIPAEDVPVAQKDIARRCNRYGIPVIVATQMLEVLSISLLIAVNDHIFPSHES